MNEQILFKILDFTATQSETGKFYDDFDKYAYGVATKIHNNIADQDNAVISAINDFTDNVVLNKKKNKQIRKLDQPLAYIRKRIRNQVKWYRDTVIVADEMIVDEDGIEMDMVEIVSDQQAAQSYEISRWNDTEPDPGIEDIKDSQRADIGRLVEGIKKGVEVLTPKQNKRFMRHLEGESIVEIAKSLGISNQAVIDSLNQVCAKFNWKFEWLPAIRIAWQYYKMYME
ncbi:hypothetical protein ACFLXY_08560 [Chloroflexota bacterium]